MFTIIDLTISYEYEKYTLKYVKIKYRKTNFSIIIQQSQTKETSMIVIFHILVQS